jgi:prophage maintenance system killer protein
MKPLFLAFGVMIGVVAPISSWGDQHVDSCKAIFASLPPKPVENGRYVEFEPQRMVPESQLYRHVRVLLDKPMTPEWRRYVQAQLVEIDQNLHQGLTWNQLRKLVQGETISGRSLSAKQRDQLTNLYETIQKERSESSNTIQGVMGDHLSGPAYRQWRQANQLVSEWVDRNEPLTLENIKILNRYLFSQEEAEDKDRRHSQLDPARGMQQAALGMMLWNPFFSPQAKEQLRHIKEVQTPARRGEYRTFSMPAGGDIRRCYIAPADIPQAMDDFMKWYGAAEKVLHPVALAAHAYRRLVSIHPFQESNGRTSRMVMDWILQRSGYPPALHSSDVIIAVFGRYDETDIILHNSQFTIANHSTGRAISMLAESVARTSNQLRVYRIEDP